MAEHSTLRRFLLPALIIVGAAGIAVFLTVMRREPPRAQARQKAPLVETIIVFPDSHRIVLSAYGSVVPKREVQIVPQVSGQITWVNPQFVPGGVVRKGDVLFVIDSSDYTVAVQEASSALQQAQARLEQEQGQQQVARREWELFGDDVDSAAANRSLALRKPQLESARASVSAARARLERARLNIRRTQVRAPFNGFVRNENADIGQLVSAQSPAGTLVGTDVYWLRVALPEENIPYISIPGITADTGSPARIRHVVGGREIIRTGRVEKLFGDVEPTGRMARLLVGIEDPMGLRDVDSSVQSFMPLLIDAYVEVFIEGARLDSIYAIPRAALRNGSQLYLFGADSSLHIAQPDIAWRSEDSVYVKTGLEPGAQVITSALTSPVEGMRVRAYGGPGASVNSKRRADPDE